MMRPMEIPVESPLFEIVTTTTGAISIKNNAVGEIMHNPVGPWLEANSLYIEQSQLGRRLQQMNAGEELVIFDVGLGAAANALAVLHCARECNKKIRLISFEKDLSLLRFALEHSEDFAHFSGFETAIGTLLLKGEWHSENIAWELRHGNFLELIDQENFKADFIYFDPYSPKMNKEMWGMECFKKIRERCAPDAVLYTYSRATPIRAALLASGFYVGSGVATGLKDETTQAALDINQLSMPLGKRWLERWNNSHTPLPFDCTTGEAAGVREKILGHGQFYESN